MKSPPIHRFARVLVAVFCSAGPAACYAGAQADGGRTTTTTGGMGGVASNGSPSETGSETGSETPASTTSVASGPLGSEGGESSGLVDGTTGGSASGSSSGEPGGEDVDLERYEPAGDVVDLPAPAGNASGVAWNYDTDRIWVVQNGAARFVEYAADDLSAPIRSVRLIGINGSDTEGLVYIGNGEVAVAFEGGYGVHIADVPDGDDDVDVGVKQTLTLAPPPPVGNNGLEGIAYDADDAVFYAVGEGQDPAAPRRFFRFARPAVTTGDFSWQDPELDVGEPFDADTALPGTGASLDLAGIAFDHRDGNVLIVSHTGRVVIQVDPTGAGTILSELELPPAQWEGVTLVGPDNDLLVIGEANLARRYTYEPLPP